MKSNCGIPIENLVRAYLNAKRVVFAAGFGQEVVWQRTVSLKSLTEIQFLSEVAWVILSAGMKEAIVRKKFPDISRAFFFWESAQKIRKCAKDCFRTSIKTFNHPKKINAIIDVARRTDAVGFDQLRVEIVNAPLETLQQFPFIGPVTVFHLAKNIGVPVAKPDRHLKRLACACGFTDVQDFCHVIANQVGDGIPEIDIVLWRFATLLENYVTEFMRAITNESHQISASQKDDNSLHGVPQKMGTL